MSLNEKDICEAFLNKRQILLQEEIKVQAQERVSSSILYLNTLNESPITLIIDSGGGFATCGMYICDAIANSTAKVDGLVIGTSYSMAFRILQHCDKRIAYPHARFMTHALRLNDLALDQIDFDEHIANMRAWDTEALELLGKRSGQPMKKLLKWSKEEKYFVAGEALKLGFIDEIKMPKRILPSRS